MANKEKVSVAIDAEELAWAKRRARRGVSLSSVMSAALKQARQLEARKDIVDWLFESQDRPTKLQMNRVAKEWE